MRWRHRARQLTCWRCAGAALPPMPTPPRVAPLWDTMTRPCWRCSTTSPPMHRRPTALPPRRCPLVSTGSSELWYTSTARSSGCERRRAGSSPTAQSGSSRLGRGRMSLQPRSSSESYRRLSRRRTRRQSRRTSSAWVSPAGRSATTRPSFPASTRSDVATWRLPMWRAFSGSWDTTTTAAPRGSGSTRTTTRPSRPISPRPFSPTSRPASTSPSLSPRFSSSWGCFPRGRPTRSPRHSPHS
mmetsp:Transcript_23981/g.77412  ORF Transcript_23981/g.77412 Transcript_23981/m.77412 type:complete len:242 (+) Transcript_23981:308-1033(+)